MSYYTTIKVVNSVGKAVKAEVSCGGKTRGFTNPNTGEISFDLVDQSSYSVSAKRMGTRPQVKFRGRKTVTLRLS